jgi:hypothetical protein
MNAKEELLNHIADRQVKYVQINHELDWGGTNIKIEGTLEEVLPRLDFDYDSGYGCQELFGTIWYNDGSWSDRGEYDGSEWWQYQKCPPLAEGAIKEAVKRIEKCDGCGRLVNLDNGIVVATDNSYGALVHNSICNYVYGRRGWRQLGAYDG